MRQRLIQTAGLVVAFLLAVPSVAAAAQRYVVRPGDTLWAIAERYQVSVDALAAANGLADRDALSLGQRLFIPVKDARPAALRSRSAPVTHVVASGDTLWSIASRHGVSVEAVVAANRLADPDALHLGQRLVIPVPASRLVPPSAGHAVVRPAVPAVAPRPVPAGALPSRGAKWGSALLTTASRLIGVPYRWGGMSPRGFDCSGFVGYVMRTVGVVVPRTTYAMWAEGRPVPRDELKVGDIVFFQTTRPGPSHAGIYIGNNQFVQASSGFGRVTVTSMDYRYYKPRYLGARRF